jgi:hypothetical protein
MCLDAVGFGPVCCSPELNLHHESTVCDMVCCFLNPLLQLINFQTLPPKMSTYYRK